MTVEQDASMDGSTTSIQVEDADPLRLAFLEQSDLGNAERLKALAGGKLKWIEDLQLWAFYDGKRFDVERGAIEAQRLAHRVVRHIREESRCIYELHGRVEQGESEAVELLNRLKGAKYDSDNLKSLGSGLLKHALKSGSAGMTSGMLRQARSDLACLSEDFDRDPLAYNVLNGTLRFVRGAEGKWSVRFSPHEPADMLMQLADVAYEPDDACPFWVERLEQIQPEPEQRAALQPLYGYTLTGLTSDQAFYVHQGKGNDGKSATQQALGELHGDYFRHAGVKTFLQGAERGGAEHRSDLVRLKGDIRFVTCDEPPQRSTWDGQTMKQVTGSLITARGSGAATEITYRPRFKLHPECNVLPRPPGDDKGFRRRFKLFQWKVSLPLAGEPGNMPIDEVLARLKDERSGILNWLIAGALEWLETRTIPQPSAMAEVLKDYWSASSPLGDWMDEWCDTSDPDALSYAAELWKHFKEWKEAAGIETGPTTTTAFGNALRDKQFARIKDSKGLVQRKGIRLLSTAEHDARFVGGSAADLARAASSLSRSGDASGLSDDADQDVP
jgi:putative DNA primase/helicase